MMLPYEIHITVRTNDIDRFVQVCKMICVKPIVIDLQDSSGSSVMHDVMTSSKIYGDLKDAYDMCADLHHQLKEAGLDTIRTKVETVPWHESAPIGNYPMPDGCYFESHIPIVVDANNIATVRSLAKQIGVHASTNLFKKMTNDVGGTLMLTLRRMTGNYQDFLVRLEQCLTALKDFDVGKVETEYAIFDSNVHHDAAWLK